MQLFITLADALVGNIVDALVAVAVAVPLLCIRSVVALLLELIWFQFFHFYAPPVAGCLNVALGQQTQVAARLGQPRGSWSRISTPSCL